jgi:DNA-binding transcriptional MerR regulator
VATPGKAEGAMRTIGEVSTELGVKPHILRYWEAQFDSIRPLKRAGGRRYYRPEDVETLRTIDRLLNREGFTVRGARQYLAGKAAKAAPAAEAPPSAPAPSAPAAPAIDLAALRAIRDRLAAALEAA